MKQSVTRSRTTHPRVLGENLVKICPHVVLLKGGFFFSFKELESEGFDVEGHRRACTDFTQNIIVIYTNCYNGIYYFVLNHTVLISSKKTSKLSRRRFEISLS